MNLDNIKAAFFDLDGTLIDTEKIYVKCWKKAGDLCGYPMDWDRVYSLRSTDHQLAAERFKEYYGDDDAYMKIRAKRKEIMAEVLKTEKILPKKGVKKIVDFFKERGIKIAVVTASTVEVADDYMTRAGIRDLFDVIISARGVKRGKPFPYVYEYATDYMNLKPEECIAFEDSQNGIMSAKAAGIHTVFIPDLTPLDESVSEYVDESFLSLEAFAEKYSEFGV